MTGVPMAAALAGVPAGVQSLGPWAGRRQLFIRFAGEAETATMYMAPALIREIQRQTQRSTFHSIVIGGRDPLASVPFLKAALDGAKPTIPVMLDTDGMRPEELPALLGHLALVQVTVEFTGSEAALDHALETLQTASKGGVPHALALVPREDTTDSVLMRLVEEVHRTCPTTQIVIHPPVTGEPNLMVDRRWASLLEAAMAVHADTRLALRVLPPTGLR
jgi:organic radical activating enzyme